MLQSCEETEEANLGWLAEELRELLSSHKDTHLSSMAKWTDSKSHFFSPDAISMPILR